uniref:Uncharacterized protein n=1 Tax=Planktothricoides sp. SpSt-374 TaxID=2282167 RepID=A0A7C3ZLS1_9CYAN
MGRMQASLAQIEGMWGIIGTQGSLVASTVQAVSPLDTGGRTPVNPSINYSQSKVTFGSSTNFPIGFFSNQLSDRLQSELRLADNLGVRPLKVGDPGFDDIINEGTVKWAVTVEGELLVIPKFVSGREISHTVITRGEPVLTAGEAEIVGTSGQYILLSISNYSGHFQPSRDSLERGITAFSQQGVDAINADLIKSRE